MPVLRPVIFGLYTNLCANLNEHSLPCLQILLKVFASLARLPEHNKFLPERGKDLVIRRDVLCSDCVSFFE